MLGTVNGRVSDKENASFSISMNGVKMVIGLLECMDHQHRLDVHYQWQNIPLFSCQSFMVCMATKYFWLQV